MNYITRDQLVEHLQISHSTLGRLMKDGLPYVKVKGHRLVRFDLSKVKEWLGNGGYKR